jgi:hypothetical protein
MVKQINGNVQKKPYHILTWEMRRNVIYKDLQKLLTNLVAISKKFR